MSLPPDRSSFRLGSGFCRTASRPTYSVRSWARDRTRSQDSRSFSFTYCLGCDAPFPINWTGSIDFSAAVNTYSVSYHATSDFYAAGATDAAAVPQLTSLLLMASGAVAVFTRAGARRRAHVRRWTRICVVLARDGALHSDPGRHGAPDPAAATRAPGALPARAPTGRAWLE
jgi:hypothetical protein